jgi:hypothetical protein
MLLDDFFNMRENEVSAFLHELQSTGKVPARGRTGGMQQSGAGGRRPIDEDTAAQAEMGADAYNQLIDIQNTLAALQVSEMAVDGAAPTDPALAVLTVPNGNDAAGATSRTVNADELGTMLAKMRVLVGQYRADMAERQQLRQQNRERETRARAMWGHIVRSAQQTRVASGAAMHTPNATATRQTDAHQSRLLPITAGATAVAEQAQGAPLPTTQAKTKNATQIPTSSTLLGLLQSVDSTKFGGLLTEKVTDPEAWMDQTFTRLDLANLDDEQQVVCFGQYLEGEALETYKNLKKECKEADVKLTTEVLRARFKDKYAKEVRDPSQVARSKLYGGTVAQSQAQTVAQYTQAFRQVVAKCKGMAEPDKIAFYGRGLLPDLRVACAVDAQGRVWQKFEDLVDFAFGQEIRLATAKACMPVNQHRPWNNAAPQTLIRNGRIEEKSLVAKDNGWVTIPHQNKRPRDFPRADGASGSGINQNQNRPFRLAAAQDDQPQDRSTGKKQFAKKPKKKMDDDRFGPPGQQNTKWPHLCNREVVRRYNEGVCMMCGVQGHMTNTCPDRDGSGSGGVGA